MRGRIGLTFGFLCFLRIITLSLLHYLYICIDCLKTTIGMQGSKTIDYSDKSLFEDCQYIPSPDEKEFYTPEEAYELVMSDVRSVYFMKDAV